MKNIFRLATAFRYNCYTRYNIPYGLSLSGTPLNETLIALHQILPQFQKENKLQKVQCVILTDGEAAMPKYTAKFSAAGRTNLLWAPITLDPILSSVTVRLV